MGEVMSAREIENAGQRIALMLSWPLRTQVDLSQLTHNERRKLILSGAIVGAPADPEAFG